MIRALALVAGWIMAGPAIAQSDPGIDQIPATALPPAPSPASSVTSHIYLQGDLTLDASRNDLVVPLPPPAPASAQARLILDTRITGPIGDNVSFTYSGRFNLQAENGSDVPAREMIRNDLREAYLAWQGGPNLFVELGRINLKSGVAEGFNPTDYFKTRAVVEPVSADPTVLREDRLGTAMAFAQMIWSRGSLSVAFAPKLTSDSPPYLAANLPQFDPMFDRTNARTRALVKASVQLLDDVSPEVLAYDEDGHTKVGFNLTKGFGRATIAYVEWSGGRRASLASDASPDGLDNHVLPAMPPIPVSGVQGFANDLSVGVGYTTKIGVHLDLEYQYHQAGFSAADWRHWFDATSPNPLAQGGLWFIRGYANDQQEPMARNSLFMSADWRNAFVRDLNLSAFADTDLRDGSVAGQLAADYFASPVWTIGGLVDFESGRARSNFGSLPQDFSLLLKLTRYFQ
jgi:hypothetical protein